MAVNKRLLQGAAAAGELVPSEHFGVVLYEGDGSSSHSINGGKFGAAFYGNGSNSYIDFGDNIFKFDEFSVSFWVNVSSFVNNQVIYNHYDEIPSQSAGSLVRTNSSGNILVDCWTPPSTYGGNVTSTSTLSANTWYHIGITLTQSQVKIYINGSLDKTGSISGFGYHSTHNFGLGAYLRTGSSPSSFFNGKIDQFRMFQKALSSSEVSTLYAETASTVESLDPLSEDTTDTLQVLGDSSCIATYRFENNEDDLSGNYDGTGNEIQYAAGRYGQAASFNGSGSYLNIPNVNSLFLSKTTSSVSFWFKLLNNSSKVQLFSDYAIESWNYAVSIEINGTLGISSRYNGGQITDAYSSNTYDDGNWHHICITHDIANSSQKAYIDGNTTPVITITIPSETWASSYQNSAKINIGHQYFPNTSTRGEYLNGTIDQLRIFNKALSASEVTTLYNENSLVASYRFEGNANDDTRNYDGTASNVTYEYGLNFTPDFVWTKCRDVGTTNHTVVDSTRGASETLRTQTTNAETTRTNAITSFDSGGFSVGDWVDTNGSGRDFVAWCLKANGGTTSSNTDGTITSTVQANQDAGFSIVTYTGNGTQPSSIGHGLSSAPTIVMNKCLSLAGTNWHVYTSSTGATSSLVLNDSAAAYTGVGEWNTAPDSTRIYVGNTNTNASGRSYISYCFHDVDGFSKFGSYTGNGSANGPIVETGFEPAFLMIKRTDTDPTGGAGGVWIMYDNKRNPSNPRNTRLWADNSAAEATYTQYSIDFLSNGFQLKDGTAGYAMNTSGGNYIYMAFAADPDTEAPTVAKSFTSVAYTGTGTNQKVEGLGFAPNLVWIKSRSTTNPHVLHDTVRGIGNVLYSNLTNAEADESAYFTSVGYDYLQFGTNAGNYNNTGTDYVAWAWKADDNEPTIFGGPAIAVYKFEDNANDVTGDYNGTATDVTYTTGKFNKAASFNGSSSKVENSAISSKLLNDYSISFWVYLNTIGSLDGIMGLYTSNTNDGMSLAFANGNLILNAGDGQSQYNPGSPILSTGQWQHIVITLKDGGDMKLYIDGNLQTTLSSINNSATSSSILRLGLGSRTNNGLYSYNQYLDGEIDQVRIYSGAVSDIGVAALYAETVSDNDDLTLGGPPETIISANANAGFSIVKWEGDGERGKKTPHGLSAAPELIILKDLSATNHWVVGNSESGWTKAMHLDLTNADNTSDAYWFDTAPTSTVFTTDALGTAYNVSGNEYIAYCFHSVSGYSKIGSYTGNNTSTSVTTGFQPDFVMLKRTTAIGNWNIWDSVRNGSSGSNDILYPNKSDAETDAGSGRYITFDSNGFTIYGDSGDSNANGHTYIYAAFKIN